MRGTTGSKCLYLDKRHCLSVSQNCVENFATGSPLHFWRPSKLEQLRYRSIFQLSNFCIYCQKRWNLAGTRCNFHRWSPIKLFRLPKATKQLSTFQTRLQASIFLYWLAASQPPLLMRTIHPFLLTKKYHALTPNHKLYVLCHKSLKDISPRIGYNNKERLRLVYTNAHYDRELLEPDIDTGESANQAFSSGNTGPQRRVARMVTTTKLMRFFRFVLWSVSKTKIKFFQNENVFI